MIPLEDFKKLMKVLELSSEELTKAGQQFSEIFEDFDGIPKGMARVEDALVDALSSIMGTDLVEWWVYDTFFGTVPVTYEISHRTITISNLDELYLAIKEINGIAD